MRRYALYNGAGVVAVAVALVLTQLRTDGPWLDVALFFCGPIVAAVPLALVVGRVSRRRFDRLGVTAQPASQVAKPGQARPVGQPARVGRVGA